jgi:hypothetical protein
VVTISFTATDDNKSTGVSETVIFAGSGTAPKPAESDVEVNTSNTTSGLSIASQEAIGNVHTITLKGTNVLPIIPGNLQGDYGMTTGFAVITLTGIKPDDAECRIQQVSHALITYVGDETANENGPNYNGPKDQNDIEDAYSLAPSNVYFWKTPSPVTYNKLKKYPGNDDGDFSVMLAPAPGSDQTVTVIKKDGTGNDEVTTTYIIDYSAVTFNMNTIVKATTTADSTTSGLNVDSATATGNVVDIILTGAGVTLSMDENFKTANFPEVQNAAVITLNGILIPQEASRIQQANPGFIQYVGTGKLGAYAGATNYNDEKTQAQIEDAWTAGGGDTKTYFWKTKNPVTYNKMKNYAASADGDFSSILIPTTPVADQKITIIKKVGDFTTTFNIDYSAVTFAPAAP